MRKLIAEAALLGALIVPGTGAQAGDAEAAAPSLVTMEPITVPIIAEGRLQGGLEMKLVLDAANPVAATQITEQMPRVRAASVAAALDFARLHASTLTPVDVARLDGGLTTAVQGAVPGISRVLIVEVAAMAT